jgi:SAM-dependent methyltransferase
MPPGIPRLTRFLPLPTNRFRTPLGVPFDGRDIKMAETSEIILWQNGDSVLEGICPICGGNEARPFLNIFSHYHNKYLEVLECHGCKSVSYPEDSVIGYEPFENNDWHWKHYVEVGSGIDFMLSTVNCVPHPPGASLLEIGSGFGFVLDYWKKFVGGRAVGLETARYGKIGKEILGLEVYHEYLEDCAAVKDEQFDFVYATEVIEHVPSPRAFIEQLKRKLLSNGVMILTTPAREFLDRARPPEELLAPLSPGFHYFLLSRPAFESLLRDAGFAHVEVRQIRERLVAVASMRDLPKMNLNVDIKEEYMNYLKSLLSSSHPIMRSGALYRLFKENVNQGTYREAGHFLEDLKKLCKDHYEIDLEALPLNEILATENAERYHTRYPSWLGCSLYYMGIYATNFLDDQRVALRYFDAATQLIRHEKRLGSLFPRKRQASSPPPTTITAERPPSS